MERLESMESGNNTYGNPTFARPPVIPNQIQYHYHSPDGTTRWKGPRRVCIFCTLALVLPSLLISIPLLMRFVIYGSSSYEVHPSDMRILDQRISTTWCQGEKVKANASFSAYVTQGEPGTYGSPTTLSYDRSMMIPDDHKKYWGLYLLPGSTFRIQVCARYKGGTLLIVQGNKHMQYCAYEGEADSAGNSDEVSGSTSIEYKLNMRPISKEHKSQDDLKILSRLKNFWETHPGSRDKIQKTLEDWMLLNSTVVGGVTGSKNGSPEVAVPTSTTSTTTSSSTSTIPAPLSEPSASVSLEPHMVEEGTIHRRRREIQLRRNTESGEDGAFEDLSDSEPEEISLNRTNHTNNHNKSFHSPHSTSTSIWKEEHDLNLGHFNISVSLNDGSDSESESSFSSSEEALEKCEGKIASFKIPHDPDNCLGDGVSFDTLNLTKVISGLDSNIFEFKVKHRDYYYFIFGSENEKQTNFIRAKFELQKMEYLLPEPIRNCTNVRECQISFNFASAEKVVIKLPLPATPNAETNLASVVETECEPRAHLYLIFVILVPIVILLFAFK